MPRMQKVLEGIKVGEILQELSLNPHLWDQHPLRTAPGSPHEGCHDIWLRFRDWFEYDSLNPADFCNEAYEPVWYPAIGHLPAVKATISHIYTLVSGGELGGCLITRIPAGQSVKLHQDSGHNCHHYLSKYLLLLQSAPGQSFNFDNDERHEGVAGDLFLFDNRFPHEVTNPTGVDRLSLIMSIRHQDQLCTA